MARRFDETHSEALLRQVPEESLDVVEIELDGISHTLLLTYEQPVFVPQSRHV